MEDFLRKNGGRRDEILAAVGNAATQLMIGNNPTADINTLLKDLGKAMDVCRVYIFEHHLSAENISVVSQRYEWVLDGITSEIDNESLQELPCGDPCVSRMINRFRDGRIVHGDVDTFPEAEKSVLEAQSILSILLVPVFVGSRWWGFIGFDSCRRKRTWRSEDVDALRTAAGLIGATLHRDRVQDELEIREQEFRTMAENSPNIIARFDRNGRHVYINRSVPEMLEMPMDLFIGKTHAEVGFPEEISTYWKECIFDVFKTAQSCSGESTLETDGREISISWRMVPEFDKNGTVSTVLGVAQDITPIMTAQKELAESREQLRELNRHAMHIREDEQRNIAQRIHDDFGQRLTTLTMDLTRLRDTLCQPGSPEAHRLDTDLNMIRELLALARDISMELRPSVLDHFGLAAALEWLAESIENSSGISVELDIDETLNIGNNEQDSLFRIARELLTNIVRHAAASNVNISLNQTDHTVRMFISDDGIGISDDTGEIKTMGLLGVRESALAIGGTVSIKSEPGEGTTICVNVPLRPSKGDPS